MAIESRKLGGLIQVTEDALRSFQVRNKRFKEKIIQGLEKGAYDSIPDVEYIVKDLFSSSDVVEKQVEAVLAIHPTIDRMDDYKQALLRLKDVVRARTAVLKRLDNKLQEFEPLSTIH